MDLRRFNLVVRRLQRKQYKSSFEKKILSEAKIVSGLKKKNKKSDDIKVKLKYFKRKIKLAIIIKNYLRLTRTSKTAKKKIS